MKQLWILTAIGVIYYFLSMYVGVFVRKYKKMSMYWNYNKPNISYQTSYIIHAHMDQAIPIQINTILFQKHERSFNIQSDFSK